MKKTDLAVLLAGALLLTGCGVPMHTPTASSETEAPAETMQEESSAEEETAEETPSETRAPMTPAERLAALETDETAVLLDECRVLSDEDAARYLETLQTLSDSRLLCTAVVITDALGNDTPSSFAARYYHSMFGGDTSGFLLLINNDTGTDLYYLEGACGVYMTESDTDLRIAQATPALVEGDYPSALDILLPAGEAVPELFFDRSGALEEEQRQAMLDKAAETGRAVLLTDNAPEPGSDEEADKLLADYAESIRARLGVEMLLVGDVPNGRFAAAGSVPEALTGELQQLWDDGSLYEALLRYYN